MTWKDEQEVEIKGERRTEEGGRCLASSPTIKGLPLDWESGPVSHAPAAQASPLWLHKMSACMATEKDIISGILPQLSESMVLLGPCLSVCQTLEFLQQIK